MTTFAFAPNFDGSIVAPGTTTANTSLGTGSKTLVLTNLGTVTVYVKTGASTIEATTAGYAVLPLTSISISKPDTHTHIAYITASGTGSLHIISGEGI